MTSPVWDARKRDQYRQAAEETIFDVIIIGGGITGAGIARELALRNRSFCLLEKEDIAFGTSSRSSKLFHGGMRYLSSAEFGLVRESTTERNWLMHHFPNLVRPLGFMYCAYEHGSDDPWKIRAAIRMYDLLSDTASDFRNHRHGRFLRPEFVQDFEPEVAQSDPELGRMTGAGFYFDTNCDDARVTLEILKESLTLARENRIPSVALTRMKVQSVDPPLTDGARAVRVLDGISGTLHRVTGRVVVSAAGVWTDEVLGEGRPRIYPTKGVHIAVPRHRVGNRHAFGLRSLDDGRFFFVLARGEVSLIGTTDTDYFRESSSLDEPWCTRADCDYLLRSVNRYFPRARLGYGDILGTFAGIRPLIRPENAKKESDVSRTHEIFRAANGVVAIAGGKSTTHRKMAEDLLMYLDEHRLIAPLAASQRRGVSRVPFSMGMTRSDFDASIGVDPLSLDGAQLTHLHQQYGKGALEILDSVRKHPEKAVPLLQGHPFCEAEIEYILRHEHALTLNDVLCRRTEAQWTVHHLRQPELAAKVADIMARYHGWVDVQKSVQVRQYTEYLVKTVSFIP